MLIRGIETSDVLEISLWTRRFNREHYLARDTNAQIKFAIALYQVSQMIEWEKTDSKYESCAAVCIHLFSVAEYLNIDLLNNLPKDFEDIDWTRIDWKMIMFDFGKAQQMIHYGFNLPKQVKRKSRYDSEILKISLKSLIIQFGSMIKRKRRKEFFYLATEHMCGGL